MKLQYQLNLRNYKNRQTFMNLPEAQSLSEYWNTSLSIGFEHRERLRFYTVLFMLTAFSVVALHQLFSENQPIVDLVTHAVLIGIGYCFGMGVFELILRGVFQKWKAVILLKVGTAWYISLGGFILGFLLIAPFQDYFTPLHPLQKDRISLDWFIRMFPIWGLFTFLFVQHILKHTLAAEFDQLKAINEVLAQRLVKRQQIGEVQSPSQPFELNIGREIETINAYNISHITVEEHYCSVFVLENEELRRIEVKLALKDALAKLPKDYFLQIHRSHLVNMAHVRNIRNSGRSCELLMQDSESVLPVSRHRLSQVLPRLKKFQK